MPVFADGNVPASISMASGTLTFHAAGAGEREVRSLRDALGGWTSLVKNEQSPIPRDAAELAQLAYQRWAYYRRGLSVASTLKDLRTKINDNPHAEVAVLLLAKSDTRFRSVQMNVVALCLLRRTWYNNLYIDFLAKHPRAPFASAGGAVLWHISKVAKSIGAHAIWGETTQNSVGYYKRVLGKKRMTDLLFLKRKEYEAFANDFEAEEKVG